MAQGQDLHPLLRMQRAVGNQAVLGLLHGGVLQAKLAMGAAEDVYEQEADRVAAEATRTGPGPVVQRRCACGGIPEPDGECAACRAKRLARQHRLAGPTGPAVAPRIVGEVLRSPGQRLDAATRAFFEPRFGHDFSQVRVHTDAKAAESAQAVNALAYTVGRDVVFGAGRYAPQTYAGSRLLAHELTHTVQNPGSGDLSRFLEVGRSDDPAERAADRTADAVLRGERVSPAPAGGSVLRRQPRTCTANETDRADQRIVHCDDGDYRVTMTTSPQPPRPETRTSVAAGWNNTRIFLNIDVCRGGNTVRVRPSLDLPRAVGQALGNVLAGSDALTGVTLSPGVEFTIVQSDSFTLTLEPTLTVGQTGVTGGGLTGRVTTPKVTVGATGTYDARRHAGFLTFTFSGGRPQPTVDCYTKGRTDLVFECERITHVPEVPEVPEKKVQDEEVRFVFFEYKFPNIREFRLPTKEDIQRLHDQGFRVTSIEGFTSPEGPRKRETPGFEGNIALAQERADAALTWLTKVCPTCDLSGVKEPRGKPLGRSELPPKLGAVEPEPKGPGMERAAIEEFLVGAPGETPDPLAPHDPAELAAFRRLPRSQQRERAFELMRRAEIRFRRDRVVQQRQAAMPAREEFRHVDCPDDVIEASRVSFGISVITGATPRR